MVVRRFALLMTVTVLLVVLVLPAISVTVSEIVYSPVELGVPVIVAFSVVVSETISPLSFSSVNV